MCSRVLCIDLIILRIFTFLFIIVRVLYVLIYDVISTTCAGMACHTRSRILCSRIVIFSQLQVHLSETKIGKANNEFIISQ